MQEIRRLGRGTLMAKMDLESAYRMVPVHLGDRPLLAGQWAGQSFFDALRAAISSQDIHRSGRRTAVGIQEVQGDLGGSLAGRLYHTRSTRDNNMPNKLGKDASTMPETWASGGHNSVGVFGLRVGFRANDHPTPTRKAKTYAITSAGLDWKEGVQKKGVGVTVRGPPACGSSDSPRPHLRASRNRVGGSLSRR